MVSKTDSRKVRGRQWLVALVSLLVLAAGLSLLWLVGSAPVSNSPELSGEAPDSQDIVVVAPEAPMPEEPAVMAPAPTPPRPVDQAAAVSPDSPSDTELQRAAEAARRAEEEQRAAERQRAEAEQQAAMRQQAAELARLEAERNKQQQIAEAPDSASFDQAFDQLVEGGVAFNRPNQMQVGDVRGIHVVLSPSLGQAGLEKLVQEPGPITFRSIAVAQVMEATLEGLAFDITPSAPQEQFVSRGEPTEWRWQIKALETGLQPLYLKLSALVTVGGIERKRVKSYKEEILVDVKAGSPVDRVMAFVNSVSGMIVTIGAAIGVIYGGLRWFQRRRSHGDRHDGNGETPGKSAKEQA